jgi:hypothetical protein
MESMMGLLQELSDLIGLWLEKRRNASLPGLARVSGVSYPTVRRIYQKECEPTLNVVVSLLTVVATPDESRAFLERHYPDLAQIMGPTMDRQVIDEAIELDRFSANHFLALALASTKDGVSVDEMKERAGRRGVDSLNELIDLGLFERDGGRYHTKNRDLKIAGSERVLEGISHLCELFDFDRIDSRGSLFRIKTEGLSKEAVLEVYRILYQASEAIQTLIDKPESKGEYVVGLGLLQTFLRFPEGGPNL